MRDGKLKEAVKVVSGRKFIHKETADKELGAATDPSYGMRYEHRVGSKTKEAKEPKKTPVAKKDDFDDLTIDDDFDDMSEDDPEVEKVPPASNAYQVHRAHREEYEARMSRLKYEEKRGELISRKVAEQEAFETGKTTRESVLNVPARVAAQIAAMSDRVEVEIYLEKELRLALEEVIKGKESESETKKS